MGDADIRIAMADRYHRRSIRLRGYDYTRSGAYYVTVCTHERAHSFGQVADGVMRNSPMGGIVQRCWDAIPEHMPMVVLDACIVMPNHMHGIIVITERTDVPPRVGAGNFPPLRGMEPDPTGPPPPDDPDAPRKRPIAIMVKNSLGHIMQTFKAAVSRQVYRDGLLLGGTPVWQRGYYEHIIRDDGEWMRIADYIRDNPANWGKDRFNR
jgi:REP element-mobilizing transposase RayT